ncbi:N-terminal nucleophile aminohydrolases superfamily protein [Prunus dulcis]|uniref:N-terminal nucleophile aminohydrolases superfamily protein n=1 Tax=Prunus dulcis TaxID=3755 RepID=A0A4Y1QNH1_PRUDU|nr:N-terminal nucleophile aminohydrolases superfamily protein [Prunus dulcis]
MNHDTTANNPDPAPPLPWPEHQEPDMILKGDL